MEVAEDKAAQDDSEALLKRAEEVSLGICYDCVRDRCNATATSGTTPVVLVGTGSYGPIHRMHVKMFQIASEHLRKENQEVVGWVISPSQEFYLKSKLGAKFVERDQCNATRIAMCRLAVSDILAEQSHSHAPLSHPPHCASVDEKADPPQEQADSKSTVIQCEACANQALMFVDTWESNKRFFVNFDTVTEHVDSELKKHGLVTSTSPLAQRQQSSYRPVRVLYVCGADHAERCGLGGLSNLGAVVITRPGYPLPKFMGSYVTVAESPSEDDVSSSVIKQHVQQGLPVDTFTFPSVAKYIHLKSLYS